MANALNYEIAANGFKEKRIIQVKRNGNNKRNLDRIYKWLRLESGKNNILYRKNNTNSVGYRVTEKHYIRLYFYV